MAYFGEAKRKTNMEKVGIPSPCQYSPSLSHSRSFACAPFGSTQKLNRSLTQNRFTNPENMYSNVEDPFSSKNMNVKIRPEGQVSSNFKSTTNRFKETIEELPGPGQYNVAGHQGPQGKSLNFPPQHQVYIKQTVPSIPFDNLGFREDENNQMKKVQPLDSDTSACTYHPQSSLNSKGVTTWRNTNQIRRNNEKNPGPGDYAAQVRGSKSVSSCFVSSSDRFGTIRSVKQDKAPGPGTYTYKGGKTTSFNKSNEGFFNSKTSRFQRDSIHDLIGPGSYFDGKKKSHSVNQIKRLNREEVEVVHKAVQRSTLFDPKQTTPGPGQYKTNYGISHQLQKMLLKKQTTDTMSKQQRKVFENKELANNPGPGQYRSSAKQKKSTTTTGKLYKKAQVVNLKQEQQPLPSPADYNNVQHSIQDKIKVMNSKLTLTEEKPFNSGTQRFKHYSKTNYKQMTPIQQTIQPNLRYSQDIQKPKQEEGKKVKRLVMTMIKVRVPFGISSNKFEDKAPSYNGPDFYNNSKQWIKSSFNIRGKLQ